MSRTLSGLQAVLLGAVVLVGLGLVGVAVFAVGSRQWFWDDTLHVRAGFPSVQGVEIGTRVRVRGMDAGEVVALEEPLSTESQVVMRIRIQGKFRHLVRKNATVQIVSVGMLGARAVEIHPGSEDQPLAEDGALLASRPTTELTDTLDQVKTTLAGVADGKGTLGRLVKDPELYEDIRGAIGDLRTTVGSLKRNTEAIERLPGFNRFVENPEKLLLRPGHERNRKWFRESDLFEENRAVLTSNGHRKLDGLEDWLGGFKHKGTDIVVASYADPKAKDQEHARHITTEQARAVVSYLKDRFKIHKNGPIPLYHSVKVTPVGMGTLPSPQQESASLPSPRIEILVFVPQN